MNRPLLAALTPTLARRVEKIVTDFR